MMQQMFPPGWRLLDANGNPVAGGQLWFSPSPVISATGDNLGYAVRLDSGGAPVDGNGTHVVICCDSDGPVKVTAKAESGDVVWGPAYVAGQLAPAPRQSEPTAAPEPPTRRRFEFQGHVFGVPDEQSMMRLVLAGILANARVAEQVQAGDLRWMDPNQDFEVDGVAMDAPTLILFILAVFAAAY